MGWGAGKGNKKGGEEEQEREGDGVKSIQSEYQIYLLGFRG